MLYLSDGSMMYSCDGSIHFFQSPTSVSAGVISTSFIFRGSLALVVDFISRNASLPVFATSIPSNTNVSFICGNALNKKRGCQLRKLKLQDHRIPHMFYLLLLPRI